MTRAPLGDVYVRGHPPSSATASGTAGAAGGDATDAAAGGDCGEGALPIAPGGGSRLRMVMTATTAYMEPPSAERCEVRAGGGRPGCQALMRAPGRPSSRTMPSFFMRKRSVFGW